MICYMARLWIKLHVHVCNENSGPLTTAWCRLVKSVNVHRNTFIILFKAKKKIVSGQEFIMAGFAKSTLYCSLILRCYAKNNHLLNYSECIQLNRESCHLLFVPWKQRQSIKRAKVSLLLANGIRFTPLLINLWRAEWTENLWQAKIVENKVDIHMNILFCVIYF